MGYCCTFTVVVLVVSVYTHGRSSGCYTAVIQCNTVFTVGSVTAYAVRGNSIKRAATRCWWKESIQRQTPSFAICGGGILSGRNERDGGEGEACVQKANNTVLAKRFYFFVFILYTDYIPFKVEFRPDPTRVRYSAYPRQRCSVVAMTLVGRKRRPL